MTVYTLTLNPAFDVHCHAASLQLFHENTLRILARDAGGKGVNISRALGALGRPSRCLLLTGTENGEDFLRLLRQGSSFPVKEKESLSPPESFHPEAFSVPGRIRENITVRSPKEMSGVTATGMTEAHDVPAKDAETRLRFPGFCLSETDWQKVLSWLNSLLAEADTGDIVTLTGSLPQGLTSRDMMPLLRSLSARGVRLVIDSNAFSPEDLKEIKPWLIKPNQEEIARYLGQPDADFPDILAWAKDMNRSGITNALVTLGPEGAVLVTKEGVFRGDTPDLPVLSTIGAGDSTLAGFIEGHLRGLSTGDCLALSMATGTAACLTEGTCPPEGTVIQRLVPRIHVEKL